MTVDIIGIIDAKISKGNEIISLHPEIESLYLASLSNLSIEDMETASQYLKSTVSYNAGLKSLSSIYSHGGVIFGMFTVPVEHVDNGTSLLLTYKPLTHS